jgi:hypothetical protein
VLANSFPSIKYVYHSLSFRARIKKRLKHIKKKRNSKVKCNNLITGIRGTQQVFIRYWLIFITGIFAQLLWRQSPLRTVTSLLLDILTTRKPLRADECRDLRYWGQYNNGIFCIQLSKSMPWFKCTRTVTGGTKRLSKTDVILDDSSLFMYVCIRTSRKLV